MSRESAGWGVSRAEPDLIQPDVQVTEVITLDQTELYPLTAESRDVDRRIDPSTTSRLGGTDLRFEDGAEDVRLTSGEAVCGRLDQIQSEELDPWSGRVPVSGEDPITGRSRLRAGRRRGRGCGWLTPIVDPEELDAQGGGIRGDGKSVSQVVGAWPVLLEGSRELAERLGQGGATYGGWKLAIAGLVDENARRRGWDSNPRATEGRQRFSRPPRSTTPAPLQDDLEGIGRGAASADGPADYPQMNTERCPSGLRSTLGKRVSV